MHDPAFQVLNSIYKPAVRGTKNSIYKPAVRGTEVWEELSSFEQVSSHEGSVSATERSFNSLQFVRKDASSGLTRIFSSSPEEFSSNETFSALSLTSLISVFRSWLVCCVTLTAFSSKHVLEKCKPQLFMINTPSRSPRRTKRRECLFSVEKCLESTKELSTGEVCLVLKRAKRAWWSNVLQITRRLLPKWRYKLELKWLQLQKLIMLQDAMSLLSPGGWQMCRRLSNQLSHWHNIHPDCHLVWQKMWEIGSRVSI